MILYLSDKQRSIKKLPTQLHEIMKELLLPF